uniref:7TM GPCR serpentine receptor class x (Srx) domain-containing protein n=1 Tax=Romanomermis culicivorax TaxID=13658 RepID=A0A915HPK8_ROMCU
MGVLDLLILIFNGLYSSFATYIRIDASPNKIMCFINKFVGGFMNSVDITYILCANLLAFNRFMVICFPTVSNRIFSLKNSNRILFFCTVHNLVLFIGYLMPGLNFIYSIKTFSWDYDTNDISSGASQIESIYDAAHTTGMTFWYTAIFVLLKLKSKRVSLIRINRHRNREMKVLLQAVIVSSMIIVTEALFFIVPNDPQVKWPRFISNMLWLTCSGINAFIYLGFNSTLRRKALRVMKLKKITMVKALFTIGHYGSTRS